MKWLVRAGLALGALLAVTLAALAWVLPQLAKSDAVRERIEEASRSMVGRELRYAEIGVGLFPPSLHVEEPVLAGAAEGEPDLARAKRVDLRLAWLPLLRLGFEVDSFTVETLELHLVRDEQGLVLPEPSGEESATPPADGASEPDAGPSEEGGIALGIRKIALSDASVTLEDRTLSPPVLWRLEDVQLAARGGSRSGPIDLDGSLRLASGGRLEIDGDVGPGPALGLVFDLDGVDLAPARPYLSEAKRLEGSLDGEIRLGGTTEAPRVEAALRLAKTALETGAVALQGPLDLEAQLEDLVAGAKGPFRIDASAADLRYGADFHKPAGTRGVLNGRIVSEAGGLGVDDAELTLRNLVAKGSLRTQPKTRLVLRAEGFDLEGWGELLPPLALVRPKGQLAVPELVISTSPLAAVGQLGLADLQLRPGEMAPLSFNGGIDLKGSALRARDLVVRAAEQTLRVEGGLDQLFSSPRYDLKLSTKGADANALLASFADQPDRLHGPLDATATLKGPLGGDRPFLEAMKGDLQLGIEGGRIVGKSLLEAVLGPLGASLAQAEIERGGRDLKRYYKEEFESLRAALRIADGVILTQPVTLRYPEYEAELSGPIALTDLALDLRGTITLYETLDAELAKAFGARSSYSPRKRAIPLASVGGTLGAPKVQLARSSVANLATAYAADVQRDELKRKVDKELGEGTGEIVDRVLDGLFGGGK